MNDARNANLNVRVIKNTPTALTLAWDGDPSVTYSFTWWEFPFGDPVTYTVEGVEVAVGGLTTGVRYTFRVSGGGREGGTTAVPLKDDTPVIPQMPGKVPYVDVYYPPAQGEFVPDVLFKWPAARGSNLVYQVSYYHDQNPEDVQTVETQALEYLLVFPSPASNLLYTVNIAATNTAGASEPVQLKVVTHRGLRPRPPIDLSLETLGPDWLRVLWSRTSSASGWEIAHQDLERAQVVLNETSPLPVRYQFGGLTPGKDYQVRLVAFNPQGIVSESAFLAVTLPPA